MILDWFNAKDAKTFGEDLAIYFVKGAPSVDRFGDRAFEMKASKVLKQMTVQVERFKQQHKLNAYKKAQLGNTFKWTLIDKGVPTDYSDKLTKWLLLQI